MPCCVQDSVEHDSVSSSTTDETTAIDKVTHYTPAGLLYDRNDFFIKSMKFLNYFK